MITPNKTTPLKNSIIYKMTAILDVEYDGVTVSELYRLTKSKFDGVDEFIYALDVLYVLGVVVVDKGAGRVIRC